jgi:20S proteasome alpha/beta subunit
MTKKSSEILFKKIDEGVKLAIRKALEKHQKLGESVVVYQDDGIKTFTGEEIKVLLENDNTEFP